MGSEILQTLIRSLRNCWAACWLTDCHLLCVIPVHEPPSYLWYWFFSAGITDSRGGAEGDELQLSSGMPGMAEAGGRVLGMFGISVILMCGGVISLPGVLLQLARVSLQCCGLGEAGASLSSAPHYLWLLTLEPFISVVRQDWWMRWVFPRAEAQYLMTGGNILMWKE